MSRARPPRRKNCGVRPQFYATRARPCAAGNACNFIIWAFFKLKMNALLVFYDYIIYIQIMVDKYKIPYVNMCIRLFARRFQLTLQGAADYLCKFKGIRFLDDCYPSEHLLPVEDALDDLVAVCKSNGGAIG